MTTSRSKKVAKEPQKKITLYLAHNKHYDEWEVFYTKRDVEFDDACDAYIAVKVPRIAKKKAMPPCIGEIELEIVEEAVA